MNFINRAIYKQIVIFFLFGMVTMGVLDEACGRESIIDSDEIHYMYETLERERTELHRLKSQFEDAVYSEEKKAENANEAVATTNKREAESGKNPMDEQNSISLADKDDEAEGVLILESKDKGTAENERIITDNEKTIYHFEIAENLYKLGEYKTALEIYKLIEKNRLVKDRKMWIEYQIANCYRKLGFYEEAIKSYRQIQNEFEGTYWGRQAQWYIRDIEWRVKAERNLKQLTER